MERFDISQFHFSPQSYLDDVTAALPQYGRLQDELAAATTDIDVEKALDLGTGTGETARRILDIHEKATVVGIDASVEMIDIARRTLDRQRTTLRIGRLEDPLPEGPFDLVVSALTVHHLDRRGKAGLFRRVRDILNPGGRFAIADVVIPADPADAVSPLNEKHDKPDTVTDQLTWLADAGLEARVEWLEKDLAVMIGDRASS